MPFIRLPTLVKAIPGAGPAVPGLLLGTTIWSEEEFDPADFTHEELRRKIFPDRSKPVLFFVPAELLTARHLYAPQMGLCIDSFNVILYDLNLEAPTAASFDGSSPGELEAALHQGSAEDLHNFMTLVGYSYHFVLESWGLIAKEGEEQMDVHMVSTSGCCLPTLRVAGEYPDVIKSVFLISPLLNDIPNEEIGQDMLECCEAWHDVRREARAMYRAHDAAGQEDFRKHAHRLALPFSVTDGLRQYMLHNHPFPPYVAAEILAFWRDKFCVAPLGGAELVQTVVVLADRGRSALTDEEWAAVECRVVVIGGTEGQPQAEEAAEIMERKLSSAASFEHIHIHGAPLMAQMTHPDQVSRALLEHLFEMENIDTSIIPQRISEAKLLMRSELFPHDAESHSPHSHSSRVSSESGEDSENDEEELIQIQRPQRPLDVASLAALAMRFDEASISVEVSTTS